MAPRESPRPRQRARERTHRHERKTTHSGSPRKPRAAASSGTGSEALSADSLAKLNLLNQYTRQQEITPTKTRRKGHHEVVDEKIVVERSRRQHKRKKRRVVSGALLEEGHGSRLRGIRGGDRYEKEDYEDNVRRNRKRLCGFHSQCSYT